MYSVRRMIDDVKALRGAEVSYWGEKHTLSAGVGEFEVDIIDILEALDEYEVSDYEFYGYDEESGEEVDLLETYGDDADGMLHALEELGYIGDVYDKCDNSYNWLAPVTNHFNYFVFNSFVDNSVYIQFNVHIFGDVRGNYTEEVLLHFDNLDAFYEVIHEAGFKSVSVEVDGVGYDVNVDVFSDSAEVYDTYGNYVCTTCESDADGIRADILANL